MEMKIKNLIQHLGLNRVEKDILKHVRTSIRLLTEEVEENNIPLGNTKIGGNPDIPNDFKWPRYKDRVLSFIAQINLSQIADLDTEKILPTSGILYFFYDCEQETWGFDPNDKSSWKVIYYKADSDSLLRQELPVEIPDYAKYKATKVNLKNEISLPPWESTYIDNLGLTEEEMEAYFELEQQIGEEGVINKMSGHPNQIQGSMQLECQLVSNGIYCGDVTEYESPKRFELEKDMQSWRLLLQVDSDEDTTQMMWGDVGRLYFWIKEDDLKDENFDKVWMILQCG